METTKEDIEDIIAEAKYAHHKDIEATEEIVPKARGVLDKIERIIKVKAAKKPAEMEE